MSSMYEMNHMNEEGYMNEAEMEQYSGPPSLKSPAQQSGSYFLVDDETGEKVKISLKMLEKLNKMGLARQDEFDSGDSLVFI